VRNFRIITTLGRSLKIVVENRRRPFLLSSLAQVSPKKVARSARRSVHDGQHAAICAEPVGNLAIIGYVKDRKIRVLARLYTAFATCKA